ncbi:hypothetical protein KAU11_05415 [Candidatus Babeliales bacterium]|nr:hypothetical protein [Candidatus Babeliales bacterium]
MGKDLLEDFKDNPQNVRFAKLIKLIETEGFILTPRKTAGSHCNIYKHPDHPKSFVNVQRGKGGKAKKYQVEQVIDVIEKYLR